MSKFLEHLYQIVDSEEEFIALCEAINQRISINDQAKTEKSKRFVRIPYMQEFDVGKDTLHQILHTVSRVYGFIANDGVSK